MANTGRQQLRAATPMRDSETFQFELGRVTADVRAVRAVHHAQVAGHWQHALAGTMKDEAHYVESTQTGIWLANTAVRVADACFSLGGGSALYETSPLQRRMRDMHAAAQHAAVQQRHNVGAGKLLFASAVGWQPLLEPIQPIVCVDRFAAHRVGCDAADDRAERVAVGADRIEEPGKAGCLA
jgi:indole-3-acetate monooxygenase